MNCGEALMELLAGYGVEVVFGMPGTMTLELYRGIARAKVRHVQCRNEQGASLMADGYARATGRPGVCTIIAGPGVTNAATGIAQAWCDSQPLLVLSGACATLTHGKGWAAVHELDDQSAVTAGFTAFSAMVHHPEELPELIARAFGSFLAGRPRPVHLSLPRDVLPLEVRGGWRTRRAPSRPQPDPAAIEEAAACLARARRPLIVAGGGAVGCGADLVSLAERIGAPVLATNAGKGIVPDSHPLSLGGSVVQAPSQAALREADAVLLVGSELGQGDHFLQRLEITGELVRIDIDPAELTSLYPATVPIQGDARPAVRDLARALAARTVAGTLAQGRERAAHVRAAIRSGLSPLERQHARVWSAVRAALPEDAIVMGDATQLVYSGSFLMPMELERCWYYPGTYCALGPALPMAVGAKIGAPQRAVLAVAGDGGLMFTVNELATAVEERLALPVLVWNNDALKEIVDQMDRRQIPRIGVEPRSPDFCALATSLGAHAHRVKDGDELGARIRAALRADGPTVIEVQQSAAWLSGA